MIETKNEKQPKDIKLGELVDALVRLRDVYEEGIIDCHAVNAEADEFEVIPDKNDLHNKITTLNYHIRRKELIAELNKREELYKIQELQIF